ncbi:hypothetical protein GPA27_26270 [Aromatoleum toluolicum]|uniref:Uncharacterized protein n=1 Tax=Aromatoleum toluolicum TaxID=90060 RepID=A0ABX1NNS1_9RHOO|nr:hypothetical protein [Aromatoleum toluolicum]NMG00890.1 hypothetical protein [Aromatoleum toluolicum]
MSVALIDEINQGQGGLNFHRLGTLGGTVTFLVQKSATTMRRSTIA